MKDRLKDNYLELVNIESIEYTNQYKNTIDISVEVDQSFTLSNGIISHNSALQAIRQYRDPNYQAAFPLRGKFRNVTELSKSEVMENEEIKNLIATIGLKIGEPIIEEELNYGKILLYTDADCLQQDTRVMTKRGPVKIKDLTYLDQLLGSNGNYYNLTNKIITKKFKKIIVEIEGSKIEFSENHIIPVIRNEEIIEIRVSDLKITDKIIIKDA
jgi:hypothetical protein